MPIIPALWEAEAGRSPEVRSLRPAWPVWWNPVSTKNTKISQMQWWMPVIPATREAEAGELLEPRRQRLQWAKTIPLHASLGDKSKTPSQKKKKKKGKKKKKMLCLVSFKEERRSGSDCSQTLPLLRWLPKPERVHLLSLRDSRTKRAVRPRKTSHWGQGQALLVKRKAS